jgi:hypothetical protein
MTTQDLASKLDGSEYPFRIPSHIAKEAREAGLLIVSGASDDLCEFEGAWTDEYGCYDGGTILFDRTGLLDDFGNVEHEVSACEKWIARSKACATIEALWCAEPGYSWTYKTNIPHVTFEITEDGDPYCRGMVIAISDLPVCALQGSEG